MMGEEKREALYYYSVHGVIYILQAYVTVTLIDVMMVTCNVTVWYLHNRAAY